MSTAPLNIFQKLMRRWDAVHPYNAAQVMQLRGLPDPMKWDFAWQNALADTGLGAVAVGRNKYQYVPLNGHAAEYTVTFPKRSLCEHVSIEMNRPFDNPNEPPFRPFIILQDGHFFAGLIYQHWLADSASIRMLMREWFVRVYDPAAASAQKLNIATTGYWENVGPSRGGWTVAQSILDMTRRHVRLRRVQKIDSSQLSNHDTQFKLFKTHPGLIGRVKAAAHHHNVKVNDIFLAALAQACAQHVPLQPRRNRTDVAVGSVVDLRPLGTKKLAQTFGLFLGFTNVICQPADFANFEKLLAAVAKQTRLQKTTGVAPASLMWMSAAMLVGSLSKPHELYHFYRKELPLAGGSSNVDLTRTWAGQYHPAPLMDYIRVSPTGPMAPLAITTTTLREQFQLGVTHRTGLIPAERATAIAEMFIDRLESLGTTTPVPSHGITGEGQGEGKLE